MKALILEGKIVQLSESEFPVAKPMLWADAPDNLTDKDTSEIWVELEEYTEDKEVLTEEGEPKIVQVTKVRVQVDEDLKAQILADRAQKEAEAQAQETARILAREERVNRVNSNPLRTLEDLRQAVQDILDHLGMK